VLGLAAQPGAAPIRLQAATFVPAAGDLPNIPPGLAISGYAQGANGYYIVQFSGPVQEAWKAQAAGAGADLLGYIPDFAFKARMNPAQAARVAQLPDVAWVGLFQPAYKISPDVKLDGSNLLRVSVEQGADAGLARAAIARTGATVLGRSDNLIYVAAEAGQVAEIAQVLDVAWMEPYVLPQKHNDSGAGIILGTNVANAAGYDGSTVTVAVADTGLGNGTASGAHPDIPSSRITAIYNWPGTTNICFQSITDDGSIDVDSGHGTHVAGSILSDGGTGGLGKGGAPAAHLVFQSTENYAHISNYCQLFGGWPSSGYFLTGLPDDLNDLFGQAYTAGARVHSNSWGSAQAGVYSLDSANTDSFVFGHRDMTITFSAGNEGVDNNANGVVDADSIGSPATAKNVITVGASENVRADNWPCDTGLSYTSLDAYQTGQTCSSMGGLNWLGTAGARWGFSAEPLKSDVTAGNQEQMAPFSSRGPTDDGRIKPDVVAPGTWILSGYSGLYQEGYDGDPVNPQNNAYQWDGWGMPINNAYKYMGGTSMANPIVAGGAAVVRDYYTKAKGHDASAALIKATLINSAVDMLDENNDGINDNDFPIPNIHEGWGRVNVAAATDGTRLFSDSGTGVATGGSSSTAYTVPGGAPFKVTLVWSDYPSTEAASKNLVNDLDLTVSGPGGATYHGNVFSGGWSATGGSADRTNNVENVFVQNAAAGDWTVTVSGYNVANGPQPYALV
ncbi:MAG: S8 family serine peptidase, partial [Candidatus Promineifilaceae bacterium]